MKARPILMTAAAVALSLAALALPATGAQAARGPAGPVVWVNAGATIGTNTSCANPGFTTIQSAVDVAELESGTVEVCAGNYTEQLTITGNTSLVANGAVTIALPSSPVDSTSTCDDTVATEGGSGAEAPQDEISICGAAVTMSGPFTVSAYFPNECYDNLYGIFVGQGSTFVADAAKRGGASLTVTGAGVPLGASDVGCQGGVGIEVGYSPQYEACSDLESASATLTGVDVSGYQKTGIVATSGGTTLNVKDSTIAGRGPVGTAENGIEVDCGAFGTLTSDTIYGNECDGTIIRSCGPNYQTQYQASGVLFYESAPGSTLTKSTIEYNDMGVYYLSGAATAPAAPEVTSSKNVYGNNRYAGLMLDQGSLSSTKDTFDGTGLAGIVVLQYVGQTFGVQATATRDTIIGQTYAVNVSSDDQGAGDLPGSLTITDSHLFSGNTNWIANNSFDDDITVGGSGNH